MISSHNNNNLHTPTEWAVTLTAVVVAAANSSTIWAVTTTPATAPRVATTCREPLDTAVVKVVTAISTGKWPWLLLVAVHLIDIFMNEERLTSKMVSNWEFTGRLENKRCLGSATIKWVSSWENLSYAICEQQRHRSACASAQSD